MSVINNKNSHILRWHDKPLNKQLVALFINTTMEMYNFSGTLPGISTAT